MSRAPRPYGNRPPWCVDREFEGIPDHPVVHAGQLFGLQAPAADGREVTLFMQPVADSVSDLLDDSAAIVILRNPRVEAAIGDEPPLSSVVPAARRSATAAFVPDG